MNKNNPITISVINQKGGVGKTTSTINIGAYLAYTGYKVLILDSDGQANATSTLSKNTDFGNSPSLYDLYSALQQNMGNTLALTKNHNISDFIQRRKLQTDKDCYIYYIPSNDRLDDINIEFINLPSKEKALKRILNAYSDEFSAYDYILVDCPPSLDLLSINAFVSCDYLLVPVDGSKYSRDGLERLIFTLCKCNEKFFANTEIIGLFFTKFQKRERIYQENYDFLKQEAKDRLFKSVIHKSTQIEQAPSHFKTILEHAPGSSGALEYLRFTNELIERVRWANERKN